MIWVLEVLIDFVRFEMAAAAAAGVIGGNGSSWINSLRDKSSRKKKTVNRVMVSCVSSNVMDPYQTLRIRPSASESEVRKAFRQLALLVGSHPIFFFSLFDILNMFLY